MCQHDQERAMGHPLCCHDHGAQRALSFASWHHPSARLLALLDMQLHVVEVSSDTLPLDAMEAMQFGYSLERILRKILLANSAYGPIQLNKTGLSNGFTPFKNIEVYRQYTQPASRLPIFHEKRQL